MAGKRGPVERFLTTVLMTDIVNSTAHAAELGDSAWRDLVQQHHRVIRAALRRHGGRELDTAGDGFFCVFDAPAAAVLCGLEIVDEVRQLGVEVRAGIHVGEVEQIGRKVGGISVVIASRIMSLAGPSEILVSSTVRDLVAGSKLRFDDRGARQLKGVPDEWHVYAVTPAEPGVADATETATARDRRMAAVRRASARPLWQRRPRLVAAAVVGLAVVLATSGLLIWKPWQTPALASVKENSIGIIDPQRNEVVKEIPVGLSPGGIAIDESYAWVTNTGADTVSQINLSTGSVENRIEVGHGPKGIAVAEGSVWVANSGDRTISRINVQTGSVVGQPIEVGNGPTAIAAFGSTLWVANATDSTIVSVDARTGIVGSPESVSAGPIALAVDGSGLWLASEDAASVSHLDPSTGIPRAAPIQLSARPSALALDAGSVWVTATDGTVTRIDRATGRVTATDVGGELAAIVISGTSIWVGDHEGNVYQIDAANPAAPARRIPTSSAVAALALVQGDVWLAAQAAPGSHRGGILRIVQYEPPGYQLDGLAHYANDPLYANGLFTGALLEADGLVGYRHVGGTAGSALLPDLATSVPRPTNGGRTYTFQLRPNLEYSTGVPVTATDFRRAIERSFQVEDARGGGTWGSFLFPAIVGADACAGDGSPVQRCDLSAGIAVDDASSTVTFNLSAPDPDFLFKLAHPAAYPVPEGVPMNEALVEAFPGTGPYVVSSTSATEVHLLRNPNFKVWDAEVRPDGFPDEIVFTVVQDTATRIGMVERGEADLTSCRFVCEPEDFARVKAQYPGQWHVGAVSTAYVAMNTALAPFDNLDARQALNFAIDRAAMAGSDGRPTCQFLPPGFPGYQPYCPYTVEPDAGGRWKAPDLARAQQLIDESGTRGQSVVVGPTFPTAVDQNHLELLGSVVQQLGYVVSIDRTSVFDNEDPQNVQVRLSGWGPDYLWPSNFLGLFRCPAAGGDPGINYCDPAFDSAFTHAADLQATDPAAAVAEFAALDHRAVDLALMAPIANGGGADFVSARIGNYQYHPSDVVLLDQLWVQ